MLECVHVGHSLGTICVCYFVTAKELDDEEDHVDSKGQQYIKDLAMSVSVHVYIRTNSTECVWSSQTWFLIVPFW